MIHIDALHKGQRLFLGNENGASLVVEITKCEYERRRIHFLVENGHWEGSLNMLMNIVFVKCTGSPTMDMYVLGEAPAGHYDDVLNNFNNKERLSG